MGTKTPINTRRHFRSALTAVALLATSGGWFTHAAELDKIHFLVPGGAGGGWDG